MYTWLGLVLALGAFAAANVAGSLLAFGAWRLLRPALARTGARRRARWLFGLRVLPATLGLIVAMGLVVPAYVLHEPADTGETPGIALVALAMLGTLLIGSGAWRTLGVWRATRRFVHDRLRGARPLALDAPPFAFAVRPAFPTVSLVGVVRPRVLLAEPVLAALEADELSVVLAHESGHARENDNLKALILPAAPCWASLGQRLEREWRRASEQAADDHAVAGSPERALRLAAALVKVARMAPERTAVDLPATAFHAGDGVAGRVRRLVDAARTEAIHNTSRRGGRLCFWPLALATALAPELPELLRQVHQTLEHVVHGLP